MLEFQNTKKPKESQGLHFIADMLTMRQILRIYMKSNRFTLYLLTLIFFSCSKEKPAVNLLPDSTIVNFQSDFMVIHEENQITRADREVVRRKTDSLYHAYGVTKQQVDTTLNYYKNDYNRWKDFYHRVTRRLEQMQQNELSRPEM